LGRGIERGQRRHPPAGQGGARPLAFGRRLFGIAPAPQQKRGDAGALGGELQPPAGDHRQAPHLADHGGEAGHAQPFFHRPQDLVVALGENEHEAAGIEPVRDETRPVQIRPLQAPQHRPRAEPRIALTRLAPSGLATLSRNAGEGYHGAACLSPLPQCGRGGTGRASGRWVRAWAEAGEDAGGEAGSSGAILLVAIRPEDLVHRAQREAVAGQSAVDFGDVEGQHAVLCRRLDMPDPVVKRVQALGARHLFTCFLQ
jgi:hypothetical protein